MSGKNQVNTLRLIRLLNEYGTAALRNEFDAKFPPASLATSLSGLPLKNALQALLKKKILNTSQWNELYPSSGVPDSKKFDISLLYLLLRNCCGLKPQGDPVWTSNPPATDRSVEANIARVRWYRNAVIHDKAAGVDDATFQNYWAVLSLALTDLGISQTELDALKNSPLDEKMYIDLLLQWKREEEQLVADMSVVKKDVKAMKEVIIQERQALEGDILRKLAKINFQQEQDFQAKKCQPRTREWLFEEVENWFRDEESESRVMIILANAGMGKTVAAATVCQRMQTSGNLGGVHFCKHGIARYRNAKLMLQSLTSSLCDVLPEYRAELVKHLSHNLGEENDLNKMDVEELFCFLLQEPLGQVGPPKEPLMFVIDALDEAEYHGRNELMEVIASYFARLPSWLKFLVTSRPDVNAKSKLADLHPVEIAQDLEKNLEDIELFLKEKLPPLVPADKIDTVLSLCIEKSQGLMLYAYCTIEFLSKRKDILWEHLESILPDSISSWYKDYANRLKKDLGVTDAVFSRFLAALVSSREALPLEIVPLLLKLPVDSAKGDSEELVLRAIEAVSLLLPLHDGKIDVFHKSFTDWLTKPQMHPSRSKPKSHGTEKQGHQVLAEVCGQILESLKNREDLPEEFSASESYALKHSTRHVLESGNHEKQSRDIFFDLEVLVLRLVEGSVYEMVEEYNGYKDTVFSNVKDIRRILKLNSSIVLVRPLSILDHIVNEAECEVLRSEARELLGKKKFQHMWLEVIGSTSRSGEQSHILAEIVVGSMICNVDISPDGGMLVVSAVVEGTGKLSNELSMWHVSSGKCSWRKEISTEGCGCCRFSPDGSLILFGKLDLACYSNGEIKPYFDGTNHEYTECQFSPDGKKLVTLPKECTMLKLWDVNKQQHLVDIEPPSHWHLREFRNFRFSHCGQYIAAASDYGILLLDSRGNMLDSIQLDKFATRFANLGYKVTSGILSIDWVCCTSGQMLFIKDVYRRLHEYEVSSSKLIKVMVYNEEGLELYFSRDGKHGTAAIRMQCLRGNVEQYCPLEKITFIYDCEHKDQMDVIPIDDGLAIAWCIFPDGTLLVVKPHDSFDEAKVESHDFDSWCSYLRLAGNKLYIGWVLDAPEYLLVAYDICEAGSFISITQQEARSGIPILTDNKVVLRNAIFEDASHNLEVWDGDLTNMQYSWKCSPGNEPLCADDAIGVITADDTGSVHIHDTQTGVVKRTMEGGEGCMSWGCVDPHNSRLVTATEQTVYLWDLVSYKLHKCHQLPTQPIKDPCSIASEKQLVAVMHASGHAVVVLNEISGKIIKRIDVLVHCICFVHGTQLACASESGLLFVDVESCEKVALMRFRQSVISKLSYDPDSRRLAVATCNAEILLLKVHSPSCQI